MRRVTRQRDELADQVVVADRCQRNGKTVLRTAASRLVAKETHQRLPPELRVIANRQRTSDPLTDTIQIRTLQSGDQDESSR